jgi:dTDP-4-amino-4,6-dideoxygalactose transaminase
MRVPLLDLKLQYATIKEEVMKATEEVYDSQYFILGPKVKQLEEEIANYCGTNYAVGVSSGTDALLISLMAAGIGKGDLVITTAYSFFATAGVIVRLGATPVFVDINPETYNVSIESIKTAINNLSLENRYRLKAIIPVHLYGQCLDMTSILSIAKEYNLIVIEDAAQAIGSEYDKKRAGSFGDFGCFSFFPSKNLGAFGDGGMVVTDSKEYYDKLIKLRNHGMYPKYYNEMVGGNFRLDALQAAIVNVKLKYLDNWTLERQQNAAAYKQLFKSSGVVNDFIILPNDPLYRHIYNQYVIRVLNGRRDDLRKFLQENDIGTEIYYPVPLHKQKCFFTSTLKLPNAELAAQQTLALPIFPELSCDQQMYVVDKIKEFLEGVKKDE